MLTNSELIEIFTIFITTEDKDEASKNFDILLAYFSELNKDTGYFVKLRNDFFDYDPTEIIGIYSALKVEFENLSGCKVH
ncbi:hypothetical protein R1T16_08670 [Flavobacterium sp. DG1-102-2]|uniref:hypothetical protein n=1 Tax=Flavobacterium sp. DG1-102-2 TaxID=3081663 RepID=UPI00294A459F|nr:hypothetical protein [Flavobacterium sp. DG1-102-2]MDV6168495.1 hypothetical protein [Flavobacterium sp. DG1-102-2]